MDHNGQHDLNELVRSLQGLRCWYVSCGGSTSPSFQIALGDKVPRSVPLRNAVQSEEYRQFEGEAHLLVWCTWRLDGPDGPLTSSDDSPDVIAGTLRELVGARVESVDLEAPAWDLTLQFSTDRRLRIFCDHVPGDPSFDGNWELWLRQVAVFVGPGTRCITESRISADAATPVTN